MEIAQDLLPATFLLIEAYVMYIRLVLCLQRYHKIRPYGLFYDLLITIISLLVNRSCLLNQVMSTGGSSANTANGVGSETTLTEQSLRACGAVMSIGSNRASIVSSLAMNIMGWLPQPVRNVIEKWNNSSANEFPGLGAWVSSGTYLAFEL